MDTENQDLLRKWAKEQKWVEEERLFNRGKSAATEQLVNWLLYTLTQEESFAASLLETMQMFGGGTQQGSVSYAYAESAKQLAAKGYASRQHEVWGMSEAFRTASMLAPPEISKLLEAMADQLSEAAGPAANRAKEAKGSS